MEAMTDAETERAAALAADLTASFGRLKRRLLEQASPGDLTPSQIAALIRLERDGPATVTALAQAEGVRSQSMGATVAVLETAGLVRGEPDPGDGRRTILSLTPACERLIREGRAARRQWLAGAILTRLSPQEQAGLEAAIALINRLVEP